jgi:hypothetical protein
VDHASQTAGVWRFDMAILWGVVLLGVGLALVIEWRFAP